MSKPANEWLHSELHSVAAALQAETVLGDNGVVAPVRHGVSGLEWAIVFRQMPDAVQVRTLDGSVTTSVEFEIALHHDFRIAEDEPDVSNTAEAQYTLARRKAGKDDRKVDAATTRSRAETAIGAINRMSADIRSRLAKVGGDVEAEFDERTDRDQQIENYLSRYLVVSLPSRVPA